MTEHATTLDDKVLTAVAAVAVEPPWLAFITLFERMRGDDGGTVVSNMTQAAAWNAREQSVVRIEASLPDLILLELFDYFEDEFDLADWTRVRMVKTVDGAVSAVATTDPAGPPESNYVGFDTDPFWNYVDEHRDELEALARRHYGSSG